MLLDGEIDAGVVGGPDLKELRLRPVIANPDEAAQVWCQRYGALPINHMVVVKESLKSNPSAVKEIYRVLRESKQAAPVPARSIRFSSERRIFGAAWS